MRDIISIPLNSEESLIIASDNSGGIGMKPADHVQVSYETITYYSFRVAAMECIAAGAVPFSVVLHNFCGVHSWSELVIGIQKGLGELNLEDVPITGSTESNFVLQQSAIGLVVMGKKQLLKVSEKIFSNDLMFAVIGSPLVGNEVIDHADQVVPLSMFREVSNLEEVMVWPVGSKGILYELNQMFTNIEFSEEMLRTNLDVLKSSGPATCFIIAFERFQEEAIKNIAAGYYHPFIIN
ncbi:ATP-binding protein [Neobacillus sp. DY30]|uniref:ATP-binding protein n=1 Tax=Neobacillus sp. DY30 TaxID=3047871 RepID=UPI0024BF5A40|nr:ATP-binding protein [Neobacillus sp. DY30]WHY02976.1 ATP-binding protein [Neobacillus sp. DY30]